MTTTNVQLAVNNSLKKLQDIADKIGAPEMATGKMKKLNDFTALKPDDILSLFSQGKLKEKDTMFWLGVLALNAEEKAKRQEELATMDELTQVYNRRAFIDNFSRELSRLRAKHLQIQKLLEEPMSLSLMIVDVDFFKKVNDKYGHVAGDEVLRGIADVLKKHVRGEDTVFRYGGEEFVIMLPDTNKESAIEAAKRINQAIEKNQFVINKRKKQSIQVTASIGVTSVEGHQIAGVKVTDMLIPKIIAKADEALYYAKENGRNQVVMWSQKLKQSKKK